MLSLSAILRRKLHLVTANMFLHQLLLCKTALNQGKMRHLRIGSALIALLLLTIPTFAQKHTKKATADYFNAALYEGLKWRNIGPFRGGRCVAVSGTFQDPMVYYMGATGGGVWKTYDAGLSWTNISDGFFNTGSVGAIAVAESDPNVLYVGMGEHPVRGVKSSHGDGVYKSEDAGKTWQFIGLAESRHIAAIRIHPSNPDLVFVAVQGAAFGPSEERGVYKTTDGGQTWRQVLFVNETTGACDLSMDWHNPRILYAGMWDHQRFPWAIRSGGPGSGIYKSTDGGESWEKLMGGLPEGLGKVAVDVSRADPDRVYANIEAENGGVYRSDDGGKTWKQTNNERQTYARAWYYIEVFADPVDPETVYVLNAPMLKSTDGGKTFEKISNPHSDQHDLWINPNNASNLILGNDGGACISFNNGASWSSQSNQPTAQFYRVIADNRFPYYLYAGQQDNSTVAIPNRTNGAGIGWRDWYPVAGGESAFIAFNPDDPRLVYGGSYQGNISVYDHATKTIKDIMAYPAVGLASTPKDMKYRFNWNAPIVVSPQDPATIYHGANAVLMTTNSGFSWEVISPDLTRNEVKKQGPGGYPYTNEGAGGENYNTISYIACSPHEASVLWVGSDDGLVHLTKNKGKNWENVTPPKLKESIINSIEVSPHDPAAAYIVATRHKFNDFSPMIFFTDDYGKSWKKIVEGIASLDFVRVVREDLTQKGLLYAGTETGLYLSFNNGNNWHRFQLNLPVCPINDLTIKDNDLIAATSGRAFWILDDLSAIQQSSGRFPKDQALLFQPKPTIRFEQAGDKTLPGLGQNPLKGLIIDYYLPEPLDTTTSLSLEVIDAQGQVVREYTSEKEKSFVKYEGGPSPTPMLPGKQGVNRFNWDLRRGALPSVPDVFVYGDYQGGLVAPGIYTIKMTYGQEVMTQSCEVLPDPRMEVTPAEYQQQQEVLVKIENTVKEIHHSVKQMREVKKQIASLNQFLEKVDSAKTLIKSGEELIDKITRWEEQLIQPKQKTYQDVINFPNQLNAELLNLKKRVDTHDPRLTEGAKERLSDLIAKWSGQKAVMREIIDIDVDQFNKQYKKCDFPAVIVPDSAF